MRYNILSVDEMGITRIELASMLRNLKVNIINVKDEIETINTLREHKDIHAIIWTINSIDLRDYDVIKRLKTKEAYKNIPIIIVSKFTDKKYIIKAIESGAMEYIAKPYDEDTVVKKICRVLGVHMEKTVNKTHEEDIVVFNFSEMLSKEIKSAGRGGYEMSILMASVARNSSIVNIKDNSEEIVALISKIMKGRLRETDTTFLYGTNNLIMLLPFAGKEGIKSVEKKINDIFINNSLIKQKNTGNYVLVTASVSFPEDGKIKDKLLEKLENKFSENMKMSSRSS
jgi:PleD family two-component response regulator